MRRRVIGATLTILGVLVGTGRDGLASNRHLDVAAELIPGKVHVAEDEARESLSGLPSRLIGVTASSRS